MTASPQPTRILLLERFVANLDRRKLDEIATAERHPGFVGAIAIPGDETCFSLFASAEGLETSADHRVLEALVAGPWVPHRPPKEAS